jgi:hypothetical protein
MRRSRVQLLVAAPSVGHAVSNIVVSACIYRNNDLSGVDKGRCRRQTAASSLGGVPERPKGSDCKSDGAAFVGSNPTPSTRQYGPRSGWDFWSRPRAENQAAGRFTVERNELHGGYGSMVEPQPSKLMVRVRFPLPAPSRGRLDDFGRTLQEGFYCSHSSVGRALPW